MVKSTCEQLEERVRQLEEELSAKATDHNIPHEMFNDSFQAMTLVEIGKGTILDANPKWLELHGYHRDEVIGKRIDDFIHPDSLEILEKRRKMYGETKLLENRHAYKSTNLHKNGSRVYVDVYTLMRSFKEGSLLTTIIDITAQKKAEEERQKLEEQLQRSRKMESLGMLAGGVAHDLNNVLSGIVGYPDLMLSELPADHKLKRPLETMRKSGRKAADIVQDLLTLARRNVAATYVVNLNNFVSEYVHSPEHEKVMSFHSGICVKTDLEDKLLDIRGVSIHLKKTIMNLVSNAAEAQPNGGEIVVSTENKYIDSLMSGYDDIPEGDYVVLRVADRGSGIAKDDLEKIFEPFYTKKVMGRSGTGLGMAVVWGTVKDHGGYIHVKSDEGKGTTFELYFPSTRDCRRIEEKRVSLDDYMGKGESILVVDDVKEQREIVSMMLKRLGYEPFAVSSGEEAVEHLRSHKTDLLVLDMIMDPGIDGLDTYRRVLEAHPGQKAIIASGFQ